MLIAVDHGNKQMKTAHSIFSSGLCESDTKPPFGENILHYKGKYYMLSDQRIPYMRDKTTDGRFFILTLFAIAFELRYLHYPLDETVDITLAVGLPPAHYGTQYKRFEQYFSDHGLTEYELDGKSYRIFIRNAVCFPQAYAAVMPVYPHIQHLPKVVVVDIGGFTADYLLIKNGQADLSVCDSLENGVITLYNRIKSKVNADYDMLLDESDIDVILQDKPHTYTETVTLLVKELAQQFIDDLFGKLRERMIDLRTGKAIFAGGGSILLRRQIETSGKVGSAIFVSEIAANTKGYELLYRASQAGVR